MNSQMNVIDSIVITEETDTSKVLAEWSALDLSITAYKDITAAQAVKLFINWSDKNGTITLQQGDYFTFVIPDIFSYDLIHDATDVEIKNEFRETVATYSIYDNNDNKKEVKITFTEYVENHTNISGDFWVLLFVGRIDSTEEKTIEFVINGELKAEGEVTINPEEPYNRTPHDEKYGYSALGDIYNGYYIFNWTVRLNMEEDADNGFHTLEDFSFGDVIPEDSPHVFLTDEIRQELGLLPNQFPLRVGEYTRADSYHSESRYSLFGYQYNSAGANLWSNFNVYAPLANGYTTVGIDGTDGLNVSNLVITEKSLSVNLGTLTRPTTIQYCTIATVKIAESALGDSEVVKLFKNSFKVSSGDDLISSLNIHRFERGGSAQGISGDFEFTFTKVNERGDVIPGTMISLFINDDFTGADRFVYSGDDGAVTFRNLPKGTFYLQETVTPNGYIPNNTIYKVVLNSEGFEIYYGDNFEYMLSDHDNKIVNRPKSEVQSVSVTLEGTKYLTGKTLSGGMFSFVVKDSEGEAVATGTNAADGSITFSEIKFDLPGEYTFMVEEVVSGYSGITYDGSQYIVTVMVSDDGDGNLTADVSYPDGGFVFNNAYAETPVRPCQCYARSTKCRKSIEGKKIWVDDDNAGDMRPSSIEIILLRDGEVYKSLEVDSSGDGAFTFCCLPIWKNSSHKYDYQIDEVDVPDGYTKKIEGYNVINTFIT